MDKPATEGFSWAGGRCMMSGSAGSSGAVVPRAVKSLLIVYHSQSGTCARLAHACRRGVDLEEGVNARVLSAWDAGSVELAAADGLLLVAAENSGTLSGGAKDFLDRVFYPAEGRGLVLPYGLVISAGNDGRGAAAQAGRILSGIPFKPVAEPLILRGAAGEKYEEACVELGRTLAAGVGMGIF